VGIEFSDSKEFTAAGEADLFEVPNPYVAFLTRMQISNGAAALATVLVRFYNGAAKKVVCSKKVAVDETIALMGEELPEEACPTKITVETDQAPIRVDYSVVLE